MATLSTVLKELVLLPREKIIKAVPASTNAWVTTYHREAMQEMQWGFLPSYTSRNVPDYKLGKITGYFILTPWRFFYVADDKKYSSYPEIVYEVPLHNIEEISSRGIIEKSLHVDAHTPMGISHFTFFGPKIMSLQNLFRETVRVHDAADYWQNQKATHSKQCPSCRQKIGIGLKYCPFCGTKQAVPKK